MGGKLDTNSGGKMAACDDTVMLGEFTLFRSIPQKYSRIPLHLIF